MGIDIELRGRFTGKLHKGGSAGAEAMQRFAEEWWGDDLLNADVSVQGAVAQLSLITHPAAPPVGIAIRRTNIIVNARTNTVGPGYHQRLCEFLHHLSGAAGIEWDLDATQDETGYFTTGNREELDRAMLDWLAAVCRAVLKDCPEPPARGVGLCMPLGFTSRHPLPLHTPTGARPWSWLKEVAADPTSETARAFFSSWHADRSAPELIARARSHMWLDILWVPPQSDHAEQTMTTAAELLAEAYREDPSLDYPWAEWLEILECLELQDDAPLASIVQEKARGLTPTIGYRRHPVIFTTVPGGWSITLPGRFESSTDESRECWIATDGVDSLEITTFSIDDNGETIDPLMVLKEALPDAELFDEWQEHGHTATVVISALSYEGKSIPVLGALIRAGTEMASITIAIPDGHDDPWVVEALHSLRLSGEIPEAD